MKENVFSLDQKAKQLAKDYLSLEAQLLEVLMEMKRGNVFIALGYTGIFNYCSVTGAAKRDGSSCITEFLCLKGELIQLRISFSYVTRTIGMRMRGITRRSIDSVG